MSDIFDNIAKSIAETHTELKNAETHCCDFSMEVLKHKSEHFEKLDLYFEADGLVAVYKCDIDDKLYTVKITPQKG